LQTWYNKGVPFLILLFLLPTSTFAVELPKTEKEFYQRQIEAKLSDFWLDDEIPVFLAIIESESGFNPKAKNWNCYYGNKSMSCKPEDRHKAWSVDCGLGQINVKGKNCPDYLFDVDVNLMQMLNLYLSRGFQPWNASKHMWKKTLLAKT